MAGENVSAISPYGMNLYSNYANAVGISDLYSIGGTGDLLSMNGSVFGGMTMPFMPTFGGNWNYENYFDNMTRYQDFMYDSQIHQHQKRREVNFHAKAPELAIEDQAEILHEKIMKDEQEQVIPAMKAYIESVRNICGPDADQEYVLGMAKSIYKQIYNTSISEDLRKYGNGSLTQGFLQSVTLGFANKTTAEENIATIDGQPVARWENTKKLIGNAAGGAVVGAGSMYLLSSLKAFKGFFKTKPIIAAGIGAAAGLLAALGFGAINKSSNRDSLHLEPQTAEAHQA